MFGPPGHAYVFLISGLHHLFYLVTTETGLPHAVLIRAVEPLDGPALMAERRGVGEHSANLCNGPGKVCQALAIDRRHYGFDLTRAAAGTHGRLYLTDGPRGPVASARRIGVDYAGSWAEKPWRFLERGNRWVSKPPA
jgi:DNA-3-methyladenine glycosylase